MDEIATREAAHVWKLPSSVTAVKAGKTVTAFLDTAATSYGRATAYNTREAQQKAELDAHAGLMGLDRDIYALLLLLPGVTDRSAQIGINNLLGVPRNGHDSLITSEGEREVLVRLIRDLPPQRILKLFGALRFGADGIPKANNARTRKLVFRTLLGSRKLSLWSVKYRSKMKAALTHAWGQRKASILRSILAKGCSDSSWTEKETAIVDSNISKWAADDQGGTWGGTYECVSFILGNEATTWSVPILQSRQDAKSDLKAGAKLPMEVLEGIRSTYHKTTNKQEVVKLVAEGGNLTKTQKMLVQKRAKAADVEVAMNPLDYDPIKLYLFAFETGMTDEIADALHTKAVKSAAGFPAKYERVGIVLDGSASMAGHGTQKLRPIASAMATMDMLQHTAQHIVQHIAGGVRADGLIRPSGHTSLAEGLLEVMATDLDAVFVISDGYENAPAGRFGEVVEALRGMGNKTPIYHINPVFAAEAKAVRALSSNVPVLPVQDPKAMGISFLRGLLEADPIRGINSLVGIALPILTAEGGS